MTTPPSATTMPLARVVAAALLVAPLGAAGPADAVKAAGCRGTLAGSVTGKFGCLAEIVTDGGKHYFVLRPKDPIENVPTYQPGSFELPAPPAPRSYTLDTLGMGMASVAAEGGTLYTAAKTSSQRGEVTLTFTSAGAAKGGAPWIVHGTYRARLVPAGAGKQGEVVVEARF